MKIASSLEIYFRRFGRQSRIRYFKRSNNLTVRLKEMPKKAVLEYQSMDSLKFYFFGALKEADIVRYPIEKRPLI